MPPLAIPPKLFRPRALVVVVALLDDQIPASTGVPTGWTMIPRMCEYSRNTARKADTATVELDFRDFPLDPRAIKDILITIHVENALDPNLPMIPTFLNRRFVGLVDKQETTLSSSGEMVRMEARDYTGIWLDTKLQKGTVINLLQPLSAIVAQLQLLTTPTLPPAIFTDPASAAFMPGVTKGKTTLTVEKESAWDLLSRLTQLYGLLPVFDLDVLVIRTAARSGIARRRMVYGQNVSSLAFHRSLTRAPESRRITVRSWDPVKGVPVEGFFQPPNLRSKLGEKGSPKIQITEIGYNVHGAYTPGDLILIAKRIYDEQQGEKIEGTLETRDLVDSGFPVGASLLGLANGDTLTIKLGRDLKSSIEGMSPPEAIAFLSNVTRPNALNPLAAAALVTAWTSAGTLATDFYVKAARHSWSAADGYTMSCEFINFLVGQGT